MTHAGLDTGHRSSDVTSHAANLGLFPDHATSLGPKSPKAPNTLSNKPWETAVAASQFVHAFNACPYADISIQAHGHHMCPCSHCTQVSGHCQHNQ
jgi:hypothetical protein